MCKPVPVTGDSAWSILRGSWEEEPAPNFLEPRELLLAA